MGYRTWVTMQVKDFGTLTKKEAREAFSNICHEAELMDEELNLEELQTAGEDNNDNSLEAFVKASKQYPQLLLEGSVDGATESSDDQRKVRIRDGQIETVMAEITYKPFEKILTVQEKRIKYPTRQFLNWVELIGVVGRVTVNTFEEKRQCRFSMVTNYAYQDEVGNGIIETTWHQVTAWEQKGITNPDYIVKGARVRVMGRLRLQRYTSETGEEKTFTEVLANSVVVIGNPDDTMTMESK